MSADIVQAQIDGDDISKSLGNQSTIELPLGAAGILRDILNAAIGKRNPDLYLTPRGSDIESNFAFYVDGYTLKGTEIIGEVLATHPDGRTLVLRSRQLTDFLERRLNPNILPEG